MPRKRVIAAIVVLFVAAALMALTGVMAHRASTMPDTIQAQPLPAETAEIIPSDG